MNSDKRILFITHQLSRTGAPLVLLDVIKVCKCAGYQISVISMLEGELRSEIELLGIPVEVQNNFVKRYSEFYEYISKFDLVFANTIVSYEVIHILNNTKIPVIWWIHEGKQFFEHFSSVLPDFNKLSENIKTYAVSPLVKSAIQDLYDYNAEVLYFGIQDKLNSTQNSTQNNMFENKPKDDRISGDNDDKIKFITIGMYSQVKGQDILVEAIRKLPDQYRNKCVFYFFGSQELRDDEIYLKVKRLSEESHQVIMYPTQPHDKMISIIGEMDCMVIPSRLDTMSAVAVESMMMERPCICSTTCGISYYIENNLNGYLFQSEDSSDLCNRIIYVLDHMDEVKELQIRSRKLYEEYFSFDLFENKILSDMNEMTNPVDSTSLEFIQCIKSLIPILEGTEKLDLELLGGISVAVQTVDSRMTKNGRTNGISTDKIIRTIEDRKLNVINNQQLAKMLSDWEYIIN